MTMDEFNAKFDDEHQVNFYAVGLIDSEDEQKRRSFLADQTWEQQREILGFK